MKRIPLITAAILAMMFSQAEGADLQRGMDAILDGEYTTALDELAPLADQGIANAQYGLGYLYEHGFGVPQDIKEAARNYRRAAEQGHVEAQHNLGVIVQDQVEAASLYRLAAEQGFAQSSCQREYLRNQSVGQFPVL